MGWWCATRWRGARTACRRTGDRHHQGGAGLPPVLLAGDIGGGGRVVSGLCGLQSQALPYLILSGAWGWGASFHFCGSPSLTLFCWRLPAVLPLVPVPCITHALAERLA